MALNSAVALQNDPAGHNWGSAMAATGQKNPNGQEMAKYVPGGQKFEVMHDAHEKEEELK